MFKLNYLFTYLKNYADYSDVCACTELYIIFLRIVDRCM